MPETFPLKLPKETITGSSGEIGLEQIEKIKELPQKEFLDKHTLAFLKGGHFEVMNLEGLPAFTLRKLMKKIARLPIADQSGERRKLMREFREKYAALRRQLAEAATEIEKFLITNPDCHWEEIKNLTEHLLQIHSLEQYRDFFLNSIGDFLAARVEIKETIDKHQKDFGEKWPEKLFATIFGKMSHGPVEVEVLVSSLYFRLFEKDDFVLAYWGGEEDTGVTNQRPKEKTLQNWFQQVSGAQLEKVPNARWNGKVLIENASNKTPGEQTKRDAIKIHEEEHRLHDFYPNFNTIKTEAVFWSMLGDKKEINLDQLRLALVDYARAWAKKWDDQAKTEVLAYLKEGGFTWEMITNNLIQLNGLYNFFEKDLAEFVTTPQEHFKTMGLRILDEGGYLVDYKNVSLEAEFFLKQQWKIYLIRVQKVIDALNVFEWDAAPDERLRLARLLIQEPISKWPRLIRFLSKT